MAKRLRGWELEMESGRVPVNKAALEKAPEGQSGLASKLLQLWATGILSATLVQTLAELALQDGANHPELVQMASTGNWGAQKGNCHRQILNRFCNDVHLPQPFNIKVGCVDPKTSLEKEEQASCFLPHMMFSSLVESYHHIFEETFGKGKDLEKFWSGVEKSGDDKLPGHPMCLEKHWKEKTIPLFIHGDGVAFQNRDSIMVFSWGSLLGDKGSLEKHFLLASFPKSCTNAKTWPPLWKWLKWSFESLGKGTHPTVDPDGKPLEKGSPFWERRGQPLHPKGWRAVVWSLLGGHEYFSNTLKLPHWASHYPCWECDAQNFEGCTVGKWYKEICLEKQKFTLVTHAKALSDPVSDHPLFGLPHVSTQNVRGDPMHILFCKGLYSHLIGGILHYACWWEGPGKATAVKPGERLGQIFQAIQQEYKLQELGNRLTNLRLSMFTDSSKPWLGKASLDCKAGEAKHLLPALVPVLEKIFARTKKPEEKHVISAATSLEKLVAIRDQGDTFLSPSEFGKPLALGKVFLDSYKWLHEWSLEKGRNSFHIVAKHHTFIHLLWNAKFLNPKVQWCFRGEDFVGHVSKMAPSVSFGVSSTKLTQKMAPKYRVLLHLLWKRDMQPDPDLALEEPD